VVPSSEQAQGLALTWGNPLQAQGPALNWGNPSFTRSNPFAHLRQPFAGVVEVVHYGRLLRGSELNSELLSCTEGRGEGESKRRESESKEKEGTREKREQREREGRMSTGEERKRMRALGRASTLGTSVSAWHAFPKATGCHYTMI